MVLASRGDRSNDDVNTGNDRSVTVKGQRFAVGRDVDNRTRVMLIMKVLGLCRRQKTNSDYGRVVAKRG